MIENDTIAASLARENEYWQQPGKSEEWAASLNSAWGSGPGESDEA